jgi:hypothetical protein
MKYTSKLTKRYYFPIVEGTNYGYFSKENRTYNAFNTYIQGLRGLVKVTNYSQIWHWWGNRPIQLKKGYYIGWVDEGKRMLKSLEKANKYLNRQYCRLEHALSKGDVEKYTKIWEILSKRSSLFRLVLIVRKLPFNEMNVLRILKIQETVKKLVRKGDCKVRYKRVFLPEYDAKGKLKKMRPLGVPAVEWRIIAAQREFYLVNLWRSTWAANQYACMPGVGIADVWIEILTREAQGKATYITGFDLAKFFDSVYVTTLGRMMQDIPERIGHWFKEAARSKPQLRPTDRWNEHQRVLELLKERPVNRWMALEDMGTSFFNVFQTACFAEMAGKLDPFNTGFPQGLNFSPILSCRALQETGALEDTAIIQYMDDGVIVSEEDVSEKLRSFRESLQTPNTGIAISKRKTEIIRVDGKWIKPLKFLGCWYDGETFKASTRKGGVYEVVNARQRIHEIIEWLRVNGHMVGDYRNKMTKLIADGWLKTDVRTTWWGLAKGIRPSWEIADQFSTWWEETRAKVTRLPYNSVEAMAFERLNKQLGPAFESSNTQTMICSYYLLLLNGEIAAARVLAKKHKALAKAIERLPVKNYLLGDW